jgi:hypothetical protein
VLKSRLDTEIFHFTLFNPIGVSKPTLVGSSVIPWFNVIVGGVVLTRKLQFKLGRRGSQLPRPSSQTPTHPSFPQSRFLHPFAGRVAESRPKAARLVNVEPRPAAPAEKPWVWHWINQAPGKIRLIAQQLQSPPVFL